MRTSFCLALLAAAGSVSAKSAYGSSVLAVLGESVQESDYSKFWDSLRERGYTLTFRSPKQGPALDEYDEPAFDHLIVFAPAEKSFSKDLLPKSIVNFLSNEQAPHNVLVAVDPTLTEHWRAFGREFGVEFDDQSNTLIDHIHYSTSLDTGSHSIIELPNTCTSTKGLLAHQVHTGPEILYSGIAHSATDNPLLSPLLFGLPTSYSFEPKDTEVMDEAPLVAGTKAALVSAFQARSNGRIVWSGSLDLFSDKFWNVPVKTSPESGNAVFVKDITQWAFQEKNVVEVLGSNFYRDGEKTPDTKYRVNENITYTIDFRRWEEDAWIPFYADDLQLEFTMLDPHVRVNMELETATDSTSKYISTIRAPDRHGVFTFLVDHRRSGSGLSWIYHKSTTSVTPLRHDEYERFITGAWPYYITVGSMSVAFLVFSAVWLGLKEDVDEQKKKQ